jgi:hypothetical protein
VSSTFHGSISSASSGSASSSVSDLFFLFTFEVRFRFLPGFALKNIDIFQLLLK